MRDLKIPFIVMVIGIVGSIVAGCAGLGVPETPREKLVAAEVTYQAAVSTVRDLVNAGTIKKGTDVGYRVVTLIVAARSALNAWHSLPEDRDYMATALVALTALQGIINAIEMGPSA